MKRCPLSSEPRPLFRGAGRLRRQRLGKGAAAVLVGAGLIAVSGVAAGAATLTVCAQGCAYTQIQQAIDAATAGDRILVGPGTFAGGIVIAKPLTVAGTGEGATVISGGGPVVLVSAAPVTLRAVSVVAGNSSGDGGGVLNTGTLTVEDASVGHKTADGYGGGLADESGGSLTLRGVTVVDDTAGQDGGGVYNSAATAVVSASTIRTNEAGFEGGGIANEGRRATLRNDSPLSCLTLHPGGRFRLVLIGPRSISVAWALGSADRWSFPGSCPGPGPGTGQRAGGPLPTPDRRAALGMVRHRGGV